MMRPEYGRHSVWPFTLGIPSQLSQKKKNPILVVQVLQIYSFLFLFISWGQGTGFVYWLQKKVLGQEEDCLSAHC